MRVLDLSQDFSVHTPAFASYDGPSVKWIKRLAFDKAGGQELTSTLHVGTHLDEPAHIVIIHTGYHKHYPENWKDRSEVDETKYFIRQPGPTRAFAEWTLERKIRWFAIDAGTLDHPMNTVIRRMRPDEAEDAEAKLGRSLDEIFPKPDYQIMHTMLFPHDIVHIENLGGEIDQVLDRKITFGCFPWRFQGGEAAFCRAVAFLDA